MDFNSVNDVTVLVVDDVSMMRKILRQLLSEHCDIAPNNIFEAYDGSNAISVYTQRKPDIVFLDIAMPDKDGKAIIEELIKIDPDVIIIMCTGSGNKHNVIECVRAGAKDYVRKPLNPKRVKEALDKVMGDVFIKRINV